MSEEKRLPNSLAVVLPLTPHMTCPAREGLLGSKDNDEKLCVLMTGGSSENQLSGLSTMLHCPANPPQIPHRLGWGWGQNRKQAQMESRTVALDYRSHHSY